MGERCISDPTHALRTLDKMLKRSACSVTQALQATLLTVMCATSAHGVASVATPVPDQDQDLPVAGVCAGPDLPQPLELAEAVQHALRNEPQLIVAQQEVVEARSDVTAAVGSFLPTASLSLMDEKYVPANGGGPVIVVGNNILGGPQTRSAYGALSVTWNVMNSGRDVAGLHSAKAGVRAATSGLDSQLADTLSGLLQAYSDLYEAQSEAVHDLQAAALLKQIYGRAQERYRSGNGTTVAIGQARTAELDAEQTFNRACRVLTEKSAALAEAGGLRLSGQERFAATQLLPMPLMEASDPGPINAIIEGTPAVVAAKESVQVATAKFQQAKRSFGPSIVFSARKDYLGQDPDSFGAANHRIAPSDYRVNLGFEQPLFPMATEVAAVDKARAGLRKAQAGYDQARLEVQTKLENALAARREAVLDNRSWGWITSVSTPC